MNNCHINELGETICTGFENCSYYVPYKGVTKSCSFFCAGYCICAIAIKTTDKKIPNTLKGWCDLNG